MHPFKPFLRLLVCLLPTGAQAQQFFLDTSSTAGRIVQHATVTTNGDQVLLMRSTQGNLLWRCAADGTPLWARQLGSYPGPYGSPQVISDGDNGILLLHESGVDEVGELPWFDNIRYHLSLSRVDPNGDLLWQRHVTVSLPIYEYGGLMELRPTLAPDGAIFVTGHSLNPSTGGNRLLVCKLNAQGEHLWTRTATADPGRWSMSELSLLAAPDDQGGIHLMETLNNAGPVALMHIHGDGSLDRIQHISYTNAPVHYTAVDQLLRTTDGGLLLLGSIQIPAHIYTSVVRLSPAGVMVQADFYTHNSVEWMALRHIGYRDDDHLLMTLDTLVMELDATGEVIGAVGFSGSTADHQRHTMRPITSHAGPTGASLAGHLRSVELDFGYITRKPAVMIIDPLVTTCSAAPIEVGHLSVPLDLFSMVEFTDFPLSAVLTSSVAVNDTLLDRALTSTGSLCELLTNVDALVPEVHRDLLNNWVQAGEPILYATPGPRRTTIWDITGRSVRGSTIDQGNTQTIPTTGWSAGLYLVHITDPDGGQARTHRVVVR